MNLSTEELKELEKILILPEESLFEQIGFSVAEQMLGVNKKNKSLMESLGKSWYNANKNKIRDSVCKSTIIENHINQNGENNKLQLAIVILDSISSYWANINVPVFTIVSLILKQGLYAFCKE